MDLCIYTKRPDILAVIESLELKGHHVSTRLVSNTTAAIDEVDRERPCAILFDFEAQAEFSNFKQKVKSFNPLVVLIGYGEPWTGDNLHGADFYLNFPFTGDELLAVLRAKTTARV